MESLLEIESPVAEVIVDNSAIVEVSSGAVLSVDSTPAVQLEIFQSSYAVVVDDIYIKKSIGDIPQWLQDKISLISANLISPVSLSLNDLWTSHNTLKDGYNFTIANQNTLIAAQNIAIENLTTSVGNDLASFQALIDTKITNTQAQSQIDSSLLSFKQFELTEASAWWQNIISTVANDLQAKANQISVLQSVQNNNSATIVTLGQTVATLDSAMASASQYVTAQVGGTTLITGFSLLSSIDPQGDQISAMVFNAGDFRIYTTTTIPDDTATPIFQAIGSDVWFTGKVTFQGLGIDSDTTTIDGGKLTANTVNADKLLAGSIWTNGAIQSSDFAAFTAGFRLKANAAGTSQDPTIFGAYIKGGTIESATLISSTINVKDLNVLNSAGNTVKTLFTLKGNTPTVNALAGGTAVGATSTSYQTFEIYPELHASNNVVNGFVLHPISGLDNKLGSALSLFTNFSTNDTYRIDLTVWFGGSAQTYSGVPLSGTFTVLDFKFEAVSRISGQYYYIDIIFLEGKSTATNGTTQFKWEIKTTKLTNTLGSTPSSSMTNFSYLVSNID